MYENLVEFILLLRDWVVSQSPTLPENVGAYHLYVDIKNPFQIKVNWHVELKPTHSDIQITVKHFLDSPLTSSESHG